MTRLSRFSRGLGGFILSLVILAAAPLPILAQGAVTPQVAQSTSSIPATEYRAFLKQELGIEFVKPVSREGFISALTAAAGPQAIPLGTASQAGFTSLEALSLTLKAADLDELAYTYPPAKTAKVLARAKLTAAGLSPKATQELAAAVDLGLLPPSLYKTFAAGAAPSTELAEALVGGTLTTLGNYKHFIGYVKDADIATRIVDAYNRSSIIKAPELRAIVDAALRQNLVTGYNLKDSRFDPHFIDELSLTYGHSDIRHAVQLLGLLKSEGIDAKVEFEPKTSAFIYLKEWGDPGQATDSIEVVQIENGNYIEYAKEYDISFEFSTKADKEAFEPLVLAYAKKNAKDQPGLIVGSWWQPLYYSKTAVKDYLVITNQLIVKGPYIAQSFSLNEESAKIAAGFTAIAPGLAIKTYQFWVDAPFYRYLKGESK